MIREFKIALSQEHYSDVVYLSQYDANYNISFTVMDKYAKASSIDGYSAKLMGVRSDGLGFQYTSTASGYTVPFTIDTALTALAGTCKAEVVFYDENDLYFGSANIQIVIEAATHTDDTVDADVTEQQTLLEEIQEVVDNAAESVTASVGTLTDLTTDDQTSTVAAINEVDAHADTNAAAIGTLSNLTTDAKTNLTSAINEVDAHADTNAQAITQLNADLTVKVNERAILTTTNILDIGDVRKGYFVNSLGKYGSDANSVGGKALENSPYIYAGSTFTVNDGYKFNYAILTIPIPSSNPTSAQRLEVQQDVSAGTTITTTHDGYLAYSVMYADESAISDDITASEFMSSALTVSIYNQTLKEKVAEIEEENAYTHITDPYDLQWTFGYFTSSGSLYKNTEGMRIINYLHIQAGSKVTPVSDVKMQYRFVPDSTGTASYTGYTASEKTFSESGNLLMGIEYSDLSAVNDTTILDNLTLDLIFEKDDLPTSDPYSRPSVMFGNVPNTDYIGQHTDATGFGQTTTYDEAIALWNALPTDASGYITETDLGEIEAVGKHTYRYDLIPPFQGRSGKKYPHVFLITSVHGHEKSATYGLYYLIKDMLEHSQDDPVLFYLRNFVQFTILPMANPYGWDATSSLGTNGGSRFNENGVNLNRNYSTSAWSDYDDNESYTVVGNYNYRGESAFSEVESQRIRDQFIANNGQDCLLIDIHTNGTDTSASTDITYVGSYAGDYPSIEAGMMAGDQYLCANKLHMDNLYNTDLGLDTIYGTQQYGTTLGITCEDWGYESARICSMTFEVPPGSTTGYMGDTLYKYTPDLIKLCGEMIGNFIAKVLFNLGNT